MINRNKKEVFLLKKNSQKLNEKKYENVYAEICTLSANSCFNIGNKKIENSDNNIAPCCSPIY